MYSRKVTIEETEQLRMTKN